MSDFADIKIMADNDVSFGVVVAYQFLMFLDRLIA